MNVLSISIHPKTDIVITRKTLSGGGETTFRPYQADSPDYYNEGFSLLKPGKTQIEYVGLAYDYTIPPTLKTLKRVAEALKSIEAGKRITIAEEEWARLKTRHTPPSATALHLHPRETPKSPSPAAPTICSPIA